MKVLAKFFAPLLLLLCTGIAVAAWFANGYVYGSNDPRSGNSAAVRDVLSGLNMANVPAGSFVDIYNEQLGKL